MSRKIVPTSTENSRRQRGRPREFDPDEVLDKVRAVFEEKGFAGASLDDLAAAAGLNRPSLYAAFGDKEQLYIHALRRYGAR
ncbi:TetR/AcrR family transcriptional regulator, partial [Acinetobacter baumannii]